MQSSRRDLSIVAPCSSVTVAYEDTLFSPGVSTPGHSLSSIFKVQVKLASHVSEPVNGLGVNQCGGM
jgi:hypothetical protein